MCNGDLFHPLEGLGARSNIMDRVKDFCAVVSHSAGITNTYNNLFEDNEALLVLKGFAVNFLRTYGAVASFA